MRERIESKHVTKEIKSQMPVIPVAIVKERGCTFCPFSEYGQNVQPLSLTIATGITGI